MGTLWRTLDRRLIRDVGAIGLASGFVGLSFGAIAVAAGLPVWAIIAMSTIVFAGGSQFMAVGMIVAGNPFAAVLGGLLLNARHFPFGLAVADVLGARWRNRLIGSHIMVDESVAFAMAQPEPHLRRQAYWMTGLTLFVCWNLGTVAGLLLGNAVGDPATIGLDAAFPAGLLALVLPSLREPAARWVAIVGATVAVLTTPLLPAGLPVLLSLVGLVAAGIGRPPVDPEAQRPEPDTPAGPQPDPDMPGRRPEDGWPIGERTEVTA